MRIGLTGTHSTGKTTLVEALRTEKFFKSYYFDVNVTRWVKELGFAINEGTTSESQELNMIKRVAHLNTFTNIISDRTIIDVMAYSSSSENVSDFSYEYQKNLYRKNVMKYDYIFYLPPDIPVTDDGVRAIDPHFRMEIDRKIKSMISDLENDIDNMAGTPMPEVHTVQGSIRERIQKIMEIIVKC